MSIPHVELTDTFDTQRRRLNAAIDVLNGGSAITPGNGLQSVGGVVSVKKAGDGLSFDANGALVGNDAYANLLTQVVLDVDESTPVPTEITSTTIKFPAFTVLFADNAFYGKKISDYTKINVPETTMTLQEGVNGAVYVYVNTAGQILQSLTPIDPSDSATKCLLGSYFRMSNTIQSGSWAYTPWNGATSKDLRTYEGGNVKGGLIQPSATHSLSRTSLTVLKEGVNVSTSIYDPNNIIYQGENPYSTKELWPGYDPTALDSPTLDTTHVYNMSTNQVDDISSETGYVVLIPGVVAVTGQDVYLMAMSPVDDGEYTQIFNSIDDAIKGIYALQVSLGTVASRVSWLGQSIVVKIGATDYTDASQLRVVGEIPNVLGSGSNYPGAAGAAVVQGLTVKNSGEALLPTDKTNTLNFTDGIVAKGTSETEAKIGLNTTNCVTHIRSSVDLETENNTVTIKAGTIGYIPDDYEHIYSDGENWTEPDETTPLANTYTWNDIIYDNSKFIAVGNDRTTTTSCGYISTSTDGINWTTPTQVLDAGTTVWWKLAYNGSMYLAVTTNDKFVSTSTDGITWTTPTQVSDLPSETIYALYSYGSTFIVFTINANMFSTTDGITWTDEGQSSTLIQSVKQSFSVVWDGSKFVAIYRNYDYSNSNFVTTSTDGITWTTPQDITSALGNSPRNYRISYGLGKYIAVDSLGYISTSTDGTTWTNATRNIIDVNFTSAPVYDGNKFVLLSTLGYLLYSPNIREGEEYTSTEVQSDITGISSLATDAYLFINGSSVVKAVDINNVFVDVNSPAVASGEAMWFDTTSNLIKYTNDNGITWTSGYSLPLAMIHNDGTSISITESFNGHGSISGMAFALPGLTVAVPNGYDSNKLLVNNNIMLDHVSVCQVYPYETLCLGEDGLISTGNIRYSYEQNLNLLNNVPCDYAIIGVVNEDNNPRFKNIFRPIDYYDIEEIEAISYHPDMFDTKWSDHILNNSSWVRSDTFSWQSGEMYKAAYEYLTKNYANSAQNKLIKDRNIVSDPYAGMVYFNNKYLALKHSGEILSSTNLQDWTIEDTDIATYDTDWRAICTDGVRIVAISFYGEVVYSTDGTTWTESGSLGVETDLRGLVTNGSIFVAYKLDGTIYYSTDLTTWTTDSISLSTSYKLRTIAWDGTQFIGIACRSGHETVIERSYDGITWTSLGNSLDQSGNYTWSDLTWDGTQFIAVDDSGGYISTSANGYTWSQVSAAASFTQAGFNVILIYADNTYLIFNNGMYSTSSDLTTWSAIVENNYIIGQKAWSYCCHNTDTNTIVVLGIASGSRIASTSTDGQYWAPLTFMTSTLPYNAICYAFQKYTSISMSGYIYTSTDGITWTSLGLNQNLGNNSWYSICFDGTKLTALGQTGYISTSTDGTTWTNATQVANLTNIGDQVWVKIAYGNGKYVAITNRGRVSTSTDGTTWTSSVQSLYYYSGTEIWTNLAWDGNKFVALNTNGSIQTSTDGTNWTPVSQNPNLGNHNWKGLFFNGNDLIAIGSDGVTQIIHSLGNTETISGVTVKYYEASNGMKICLPDQEANVSDMYTATGSAWYYILDTDSQQFKLPRKHSTQIVKEYDDGTNWYRLYADGWVEQGGTATTVSSTPKQITLPIEMSTTGYIPHIQGQTSSAGYSNATWQVMPVNTTASPKTTTSFYGQSSIDGYNLTFTWSVSGQSAVDISTFQADQKYRYFYVGEFTLPALRNTAGINTEVLNNKADKSMFQIVPQLPAQLVEGVVYFIYAS